MRILRFLNWCLPIPQRTRKPHPTLYEFIHPERNSIVLRDLSCILINAGVNIGGDGGCRSNPNSSSNDGSGRVRNCNGSMSGACRRIIFGFGL